MRKVLGVFCVLCGLALSSPAIDRDAFTFTNYELKVRIEPDQQRLAAEGTIALRNDSSAPQKNISLQISSSLGWRAIRLEGKPVQFLTQTYTSDIDHTGALSEAIVSLPQDVAPGATVALEVRYEGVIARDATRLTRIGVPEDEAKHSDFDQISEPFTAVRGAGYVVWYPAAMEAVSLSEGNSVFEALGDWKKREAQARFDLTLTYSGGSAATPPVLICNGREGQSLTEEVGRAQLVKTECSFDALGTATPSFAMGRYDVLDGPAWKIDYLPAHKAAATGFASAAAKVTEFVNGWFGTSQAKIAVVDLPDAEAAPYESGTMLLTPLDAVDPKLAEVSAVHELTHAAFPSSRLWIYEGLAHFAQAAYVESTSGRQAALDSMAPHRSAIVNAEKSLPADANMPAQESLINTSTEEFYRSKAMYVWWMLRDMVGEPALKKALAAYRPEEDKSPSYMQKLIEAQCRCDLEWFFDDWVYRDRGLPDFRVKSVYPRNMLRGGYMVTVTIENLGAAGAEVPITVQFEGGERMKRIAVRGKAENSFRFEISSLPKTVVVNDGSVPESDMSNNEYKVTAAAQDGSNRR